MIDSWQFSATIPTRARTFWSISVTGDPHDIRSTFFRVELPEAIIDEVAYRSGNDKTQDSRKQPGLAKYGHLILKRGLLGSTDLWEWWKQAREGQPNVDSNVTVTLLDEERTRCGPGSFRNAFPVNYRIDTPRCELQRHRRRRTHVDLRLDGHRIARQARIEARSRSGNLSTP